MSSSSFWEGEEEVLICIELHTFLVLIFIIELFYHLSLHQVRIRFYISLAWDVLERTLDPTIHSLGTLCDKDQGLILDGKAAPRDCGKSRRRLRTNVK